MRGQRGEKIGHFTIATKHGRAAHLTSWPAPVPRNTARRSFVEERMCFSFDLNNGEFPALGVWFVLEKGKDILNIYSNFSQRSTFVRRKGNTEFKRIQNYCKNDQCCVLRESTSRQTQNDHSRILGLFRITADLGSGMIKRNKKITLMKGIKLCFQLQ